MNTESFLIRHIGPRDEDIKKMLKVVKANSLDELIDETLPNDIKLKESIKLDEQLSESEYLTHLKKVSALNKVFKSYIGLGYNRSYLPAVIQRNILENPGWYTAYTPYQAEISQGRMEALLNFQTMITDLTGMEIANSSLLDEGTAAAEAMIMIFNTMSKSKKKSRANKFFVSKLCYPQTIDVLKTRSEPLGIELVIDDYHSIELSEEFFGIILQYPSKYGEVIDYSKIITIAKKNEIEMPITEQVLNVLDSRCTAMDAVKNLLNREQREEF